MPSPGDTICGEIYLECLAPTALGAEVFQPVFVAHDRARDERLWLTVVDGTFTPTSVDLSTFMAGANGLTGVRHPALVRVVLVDREEDYCVVGYEELPGAEPLGDLIVRGGSRRLLARAAIEVARGLAYLHRRGLLHGALTPGTVVLWEGVPLLWEYGLSALCLPESFGPQARSLGGDVVAPEVPQGRPLTPAADVYAWGAVMASVVSGELGSEAVAAVMEDDVDPGQHAALLDVVRRALSPEPQGRPRDGVHLLELLQRALASVDPAVAGESSGPSQGELEALARRYLDEMAGVEGPSPSPSLAGAGSLGPMELTNPPKASAPTAPWLAASPPREGRTSRGRTVPPDAASPLRQGEATDLGPLPPPSTTEPGAPSAEVDDEPEWGRYRLPSGTYAAIRDAPPPAGDGSVRGPEPGVSGSDAGVLRLDASAEAARVSASAWLRPAPPKAADGGVGGLFDPNQWLRELPHGVRKRWVLAEGHSPQPPSDDIPGGVVPSQAGVPRGLSEDDVTPSEAIVLDGEATAPGASERETPPDPEGSPLPPGREVVEDELPPLPEPGRASAELPPPDPSPSRSRAQMPFRPPRLPGPHGPPSIIMTLVVVLLGGAMAVGATLSAAGARGSMSSLFVGSGVTDDAEPGDGADAASAGDPKAGGPAGVAACPDDMVPIPDEDAPFCIDRAEHPGMDEVPTTEVELSEAEDTCATRGRRLCTEPEWVRACRGAAGWRYPYGPDREAGRCRVGDASAKPGPAGADPHCVTPEGVLDLVGNAAEWTQEGVVMGGSVRSKKTAGCNSRQRFKPSTKRAGIGFRCCMTPAGVEGDAGAPEGAEAVEAADAAEAAP